MDPHHVPRTVRADRRRDRRRPACRGVDCGSPAHPRELGAALRGYCRGSCDRSRLFGPECRRQCREQCRRAISLPRVRPDHVALLSWVASARRPRHLPAPDTRRHYRRHRRRVAAVVHSEPCRRNSRHLPEPRSHRLRPAVQRGRRASSAIRGGAAPLVEAACAATRGGDRFGAGGVRPHLAPGPRDRRSRNRLLYVALYAGPAFGAAGGEGGAVEDPAAAAPPPEDFARGPVPERRTVARPLAEQAMGRGRRGRGMVREPDPREVLRSGARHADVRRKAGPPMAGGTACGCRHALRIGSSSGRVRQRRLPVRRVHLAKDTVLGRRNGCDARPACLNKKSPDLPVSSSKGTRRPAPAA